MSFDELLRERGVICDATTGEKVHRMMDQGASEYGPFHREMDYRHWEEGVRTWLNSIANLPTVANSILTDYVRIALGHLVVDEVWKESREGTPQEEVFRKAMIRYLRRGYSRTFYKRPL